MVRTRYAGGRCFAKHCTCRLISVQAFREAALAAVNESAPAALPAQSDGCGGAESGKASINVEALNGALISVTSQGL